MAKNIHIILDVSVIIDFWFKERNYLQTTRIFEEKKLHSFSLWISSGSISALERITSRILKEKETLPQTAKETAHKLIVNLLDQVSILSNFGFDQRSIYEKAVNFEDAQISGSARILEGVSKVILTENKNFDSLSELETISPADFWHWFDSISNKNLKSIPFIDLHSQQSAIRPQLEKNIQAVLKHGQYIMGPEVRQLEEKLEKYTESKHCITVSSGTEALLISLMALGIKPKDEVITTPFTFVATAEAIALLGAIPVFVDIEPGTCNINVDLIESKITSKTKAIIPVSLYGQPADMDEINHIATKYGNIPVIEDAAQSFGAMYKGKKSCNLSTIGCTSFFPSKPLGCYGDGGALFTNDDGIAQACREIRVHGQSKRYYHTRIGVGGRMDTMQCAIVLAKLEHFPWEVEKRIEIGNRYNKLLDENGISRITQKSDRTSVFAQYTIVTENRDKLQEKLKSVGIPTAVHYPIPLDEQPAYSQFCSSKDNPLSSNLSKKVMSIPMSPNLTMQEQDWIVKELI